MRDHLLANAQKNVSRARSQGESEIWGVVSE
jgi:hypothetical protein